MSISINISFNWANSNLAFEIKKYYLELNVANNWETIKNTFIMF